MHSTCTTGSTNPGPDSSSGALPSFHQRPQYNELPTPRVGGKMPSAGLGEATREATGEATGKATNPPPKSCTCLGANMPKPDTGNGEGACVPAKHST